MGKGRLILMIHRILLLLWGEDLRFVLLGVKMRRDALMLWKILYTPEWHKCNNQNLKLRAGLWQTVVAGGLS